LGGSRVVTVLGVPIVTDKSLAPDEWRLEYRTTPTERAVADRDEAQSRLAKMASPDFDPLNLASDRAILDDFVSTLQRLLR